MKKQYINPLTMTTCAMVSLPILSGSGTPTEPGTIQTGGQENGKGGAVAARRLLK